MMSSGGGNFLASYKSDKIINFDQFPQHFREYLEKNEVPYDAYNVEKINRYIRLNPRCDNIDEIKEEDISSQLDCEVREVTHLSSIGHRFFMLDSDANISNSSLYKEGKIYGIDLSSAAVVAALEPEPTDHILDLCCAPGAKLAMIYDTMYIKSINQNKKIEGTITGVDVSEKRLAVCRTLCKKYNIENVRLFLQDATAFDILAPDIKGKEANIFLGKKEYPDPDDGFKSLDVSLPKKINKKRKRSNIKLNNLYYCKNWQIQTSSVYSYDKILLDAQCTLDASIRHLLQFKKTGVIEYENSDGVEVLQRRLIFNAYCLLKEGGILIYSTCSFCKSQNEDVVEWLLRNESSACLEKIVFPESWRLKVDERNCTLRFYPRDVGTSGMFIAKIRKKRSN